MYRLLATLFLVIGGGFLLVVVVQAVTGARLIDGNALGPALVVLLVGGLLAWTIRDLPPVEGEGGGAAGTRPRDPNEDDPPSGA